MATQPSSRSAYPSPSVGSNSWLKDEFPKLYYDPYRSIYQPPWPSRRTQGQFVQLNQLLDDLTASGELPSLKGCFVREDKLPIYGKHQALVRELAGVEGRVKDLEDKYTAARNIEIDLVGRLARMKESMTALERELALLRATPTKAQAVKTK